jgi:hypothetical protein
MAVEPGLAHHQARPVPDLRDELLDTGAKELDAVALEAQPLPVHTGGRTVLAEHLAERPRPLAGGDARERALDGRFHHALAAPRGCLQRRQRLFCPRRVALGAHRLQALQRRSRGRGVQLEDAAVRPAQERRGDALRPLVHAHDDLLAGVDGLHASRHRPHQRRFHVAGLDGGLHSTHAEDLVDLLLGLSLELVHLPSNDDASLEEIGVLQEIGLVGEDLHEAQ